MWIASRHGWYSVVRRDDGWHVRARVRGDLENLIRAAQLPLTCPIREWDGSDYRYRLIVTAAQLQKICRALGESVNYPNFKKTIEEIADQSDKLDVYHQVWGAVAGLQDYLPWAGPRR